MKRIKLLMLSIGLMAVVIVPVTLNRVWADQGYGCTGSGLCTDAQSACGDPVEEDCDDILQPTSIIQCGTGSAENCKMDGDSIVCGTTTECVYMLMMTPTGDVYFCEESTDTEDLIGEACRAW